MHVIVVSATSASVRIAPSRAASRSSSERPAALTTRMRRGENVIAAYGSSPSPPSPPRRGVAGPWWRGCGARRGQRQPVASLASRPAAALRSGARRRGGTGTRQHPRPERLAERSALMIRPRGDGDGDERVLVALENAESLVEEWIPNQHRAVGGGGEQETRCPLEGDCCHAARVPERSPCGSPLLRSHNRSVWSCDPETSSSSDGSGSNADTSSVWAGIRLIGIHSVVDHESIAPETAPPQSTPPSAEYAIEELLAADDRPRLAERQRALGAEWPQSQPRLRVGGDEEHHCLHHIAVGGA